ncbi:MAG: fumarate hydratase C-terminal domain-containing protein [Anaerolineae bacterium]|nr:fumarate hydratase C-terminal domain-containing protein [Anaerolineae bacterium]
MIHKLTVPISDEAISALHVGDQVEVSGVIFTARDAAHKYMVEEFIKTGGNPPQSEEALYELLKEKLNGGVIYHCGPVVAKEDDQWRFVAAGPTTSIREEVYQDLVIEHFNLKAVIGKGGMGPRTLAACEKYKAVYLHAVGGAGTLIAERVQEVEDVHKLDEFGVPEAFWQIRVEGFPAVVTMDSHGQSIHAEVAASSEARFKELVGA